MSTTFVTESNGEQLLLLATRCERFGRSPADVFGIADEVVAEAFNLAAAYALQEIEFRIENKRREIEMESHWNMTRALVETWGGELKSAEMVESDFPSASLYEPGL